MRYGVFNAARFLVAIYPAIHLDLAFRHAREIGGEVYDFHAGKAYRPVKEQSA